MERRLNLSILPLVVHLQPAVFVSSCVRTAGRVACPLVCSIHHLFLNEETVLKFFS